MLFFKSPDKCQDFIILKEYKSNLEEILMLDKYISKKEYLSLYKDKEITNKKIPSNYYIDIVNIYITQQETDLTTNIVDINIIDKNTLEKIEDELIIRLDLKNLTYSVIPKELIDEEPVEGKEFEISKERITENDNNKLDDADVGDYAIAEFYYDKLKNLSMYNIEKAYQMLDETYKKEHCPTIEEYQNLVKELFSEDTKATDYKKRINAYGETMIECKDSSENEYIFTIKDGVNSDIVAYKK